MHAVVLAGGRGRRLGILTQSTQKAVLCFDGNPLIVHILDSLLRERSISVVTVLTGYRGNDVDILLHSRYSELLREQRLRVLHFPSVRGTLSRLVAALPKLDLTQGYCVCGIDSLVSEPVFHRFCELVERRTDDAILSFSPRIGIAVTHTLACLEGDRVLSYLPFEQIKTGVDCVWCTDVGIRYFSPQHMLDLQQFGFSEEKYIPDYVQQLLQEGRMVRGFVFEEDWKHFATLEDFYGSKPLDF